MCSPCIDVHMEIKSKFKPVMRLITLYIWTQAAFFSLYGLIKMSAGMPINLCSLRIIEIDRLRCRFKTSETRALLPIHGSKSFRVNPRLSM